MVKSGILAQAMIDLEAVLDAPPEGVYTEYVSEPVISNARIK
jgi:hypothetical protein